MTTYRTEKKSGIKRYERNGCSLSPSRMVWRDERCVYGKVRDSAANYFPSLSLSFTWIQPENELKMYYLTPKLKFTIQVFMTILTEVYWKSSGGWILAPDEVSVWTNPTGMIFQGNFLDFPKLFFLAARIFPCKNIFWKKMFLFQGYKFFLQE